MNSFFNPPPVELVTAFDLSNGGEPDKPIFQFVYASQLYGTLFGVYGRFVTDFNPDNTECLLVGMELKLINYQGVINIGFTPDVPYCQPIYKQIYQNSVLTSEGYFGVKGFSTLDTQFIPIKPTTPLKIKKNERHRFIIKRILYPMQGFIRTSTIDYGHPSGTVPKEIHFDSEFFSRSGVDYFQNPLRPGMAGFDLLTLEFLHNSSGLGSPRCSEGHLNLYF